ncbi:Uu.00g146020.m01.CDS01 [Anthostomella pinea]|uniref:Uu.00g146020.m01.CDS01 n=1 Tax=Anthostomella pinea TaxID=933095 RepID=A0AAI8VR85_9PEZI|nr:Uu.00g146020.m01.CDS01 [Anthostomella pinea]
MPTAFLSRALPRGSTTSISSLRHAARITPIPISNTFAYRTPTTSSTSHPPGALATARSLDHVVLTVSSLRATIDFYTQTLGMKHSTFPSTPQSQTPSSSSSSQSTTSTPNRHALHFGLQKINLHEAGHEFEPKAQAALPGTADLCFLVDEDVDGVRDRLRRRGVEVLEGGEVVRRTGARGALRSVYVRDPDGNLIELSNEMGQESGSGVGGSGRGGVGVGGDDAVPTPS